LLALAVFPVIVARCTNSYGNAVEYPNCCALPRLCLELIFSSKLPKPPKNHCWIIWLGLDVMKTSVFEAYHKTEQSTIYGTSILDGLLECHARNENFISERV
jgi:hypothetical protein